MKILHIASHLKNGGAERLLADILPRMKAEGADVELLLFDGTPTPLYRSLEENGIRIHALRTGGSAYCPWNIFKLYPYLKRYDIIHTHTTAPQLFAAFGSLFCPSVFVTTEHSTTNRRRLSKWFRPIDRFLYSRYAKIICISPATQSSLTHWLNVPSISRNMQTISNGIDLKRFETAEHIPGHEIFGRPGIPVMMVARFAPAKDQATLVRALKYIRNKETFAVFVGDGPTKKDVEKSAAEHGVADRCLFMGSRNDIPRLIRAAAIGVQSSIWEGFGLTAVEFMAGSKPVIASDVDGLRDVVDGAGLIFGCGDEKALAACIDRLLDDPSFYSATCLSCHDRAQEYGIDKMTHHYLQAYQQLLSGQIR